MFRVLVKKKVLKDAEKMPVYVQENLVALLEDLRDKGPVQPDWPNYSRIGKEMYYCHLASFHPEMALFCNLCINLRNHLCGVRPVRLRIIP